MGSGSATCLLEPPCARPSSSPLQAQSSERGQETRGQLPGRWWRPVDPSAHTRPIIQQGTASPSLELSAGSSMSNAFPGSPAPNHQRRTRTRAHSIEALGPPTGRAPVHLERLLCCGPRCSPPSDRSCLGSCLTRSPVSQGREQVPGGRAGSGAASGTGTVWFCPSRPACS